MDHEYEEGERVRLAWHLLDDDGELGIVVNVSHQGLLDVLLDGKAGEEPRSVRNVFPDEVERVDVVTQLGEVAGGS